MPPELQPVQTHQIGSPEPWYDLQSEQQYEYDKAMLVLHPTERKLVEDVASGKRQIHERSRSPTRRLANPPLHGAFDHIRYAELLNTTAERDKLLEELAHERRKNGLAHASHDTNTSNMEANQEELLKRIAELEASLQKQQAELDEKSKKTKGLEGRVEEMRANAVDLSADRSRMATLESQFIHMQKELEEDREKIRSLEDQNRALSEQNKSVTDQLSQSRALKDQEKIASFNSEMQLKEELEKLRLSDKNHAKEMAAAAEREKTLKNELMVVRSANESLRREVNQMPDFNRLVQFAQPLTSTPPTPIVAPPTPASPPKPSVVAMENLHKARKLLGELTAVEVAEFRTYTKPPPCVRRVMQGVCMLLRCVAEEQDYRRRLRSPSPPRTMAWRSGGKTHDMLAYHKDIAPIKRYKPPSDELSFDDKQVLWDTNFMYRCLDLDVNLVSHDLVSALAPFVTDVDGDDVADGSHAAGVMFNWMSAVYSYACHAVRRDRSPKRKEAKGPVTSMEGRSLSLMQKVTVRGHRGTVRFLGETHFAPGIWVGVDLAERVGRNDGTVNGISYFSCQPKHGLFVKGEVVSVRKSVRRTDKLNRSPSTATNESTPRKERHTPITPTSARELGNKRRRRKKGEKSSSDEEDYSPSVSATASASASANESPSRPPAPSSASTAPAATPEMAGAHAGHDHAHSHAVRQHDRAPLEAPKYEVSEERKAELHNRVAPGVVVRQQSFSPPAKPPATAAPEGAATPTVATPALSDATPATDKAQTDGDAAAKEAAAKEAASKQAAAKDAAAKEAAAKEAAAKEAAAKEAAAKEAANREAAAKAKQEADKANEAAKEAAAKAAAAKEQTAKEQAAKEASDREAAAQAAAAKDAAAMDAAAKDAAAKEAAAKEAAAKEAATKEAAAKEAADKEAIAKAAADKDAAAKEAAAKEAAAKEAAAKEAAAKDAAAKEAAAKEAAAKEAADKEATAKAAADKDAAAKEAAAKEAAAKEAAAKEAAAKEAAAKEAAAKAAAPSPTTPKKPTVDAELAALLSDDDTPKAKPAAKAPAEAPKPAEPAKPSAASAAAADLAALLSDDDAPPKPKPAAAAPPPAAAAAAPPAKSKADAELASLLDSDDEKPKPKPAAAAAAPPAKPAAKSAADLELEALLA